MEYCDKFNVSANVIVCGATDACKGCPRDNKENRVKSKAYAIRYRPYKKVWNYAENETSNYINDRFTRLRKQRG